MWVREPFVPDTVALYTPADPEQDIVDVPNTPRVIACWERLQESPEDGFRFRERLTVPLNPISLWTVTVTLVVAVAFTTTRPGFVLIVKSWTLTVTKPWCESPPVPVAVIVTWYVFAEPEQERLETPDTPSVTVLVDRLQVRPVVGNMAKDKPTFPE